MAVAEALHALIDEDECEEKGAGHAGRGDGRTELDVEGCARGGDGVDEDVGVGGDEGGDDDGSGIEYGISPGGVGSCSTVLLGGEG